MRKGKTEDEAKQKVKRFCYELDLKIKENQKNSELLMEAALREAFEA